MTFGTYFFSLYAIGVVLFAAAFGARVPDDGDEEDPTRMDVVNGAAIVVLAVFWPLAAVVAVGRSAKFEILEWRERRAADRLRSKV